MTTSEATLLFEYVQRVGELKDVVANQTERIANLEAIAQALADELIKDNNTFDMSRGKLPRDYGQLTMA